MLRLNVVALLSGIIAGTATASLILLALGPNHHVAFGAVVVAALIAAMRRD